jgi:hypothetical protein
MLRRRKKYLPTALNIGRCRSLAVAVPCRCIPDEDVNGEKRFVLGFHRVLHRFRSRIHAFEQVDAGREEIEQELRKYFRLRFRRCRSIGKLTVATTSRNAFLVYLYFQSEGKMRYGKNRDTMTLVE